VHDARPDVAAGREHDGVAPVPRHLEAGAGQVLGQLLRVEMLETTEGHPMVAAEHDAGQDPMAALVLDAGGMHGASDLGPRAPQRLPTAEVGHPVGRRQVAEPGPALLLEAMRDPADLSVGEPRAQQVDGGLSQEAPGPRTVGRHGRRIVPGATPHLAARRMVVARFVPVGTLVEDAPQHRGHRHLGERGEDRDEGPRLAEARELPRRPGLPRQLERDRVDEQEEERRVQRHRGPRTTH
jgi:hypothetical protein